MTEAYKDQFKPWIKHKQAILILDSYQDTNFIMKSEAAEEVNVFLGKMTGTELKSFYDDDGYESQFGY